MDERQWKILIGLGVILLLGIGLLIASMILYRIVASRRRQPDQGAPFTLGQLRQMQREGQITEQEFERTKTVLIAQGLTALKPDDDDKDARDTGESVRPSDNQATHSTNNDDAPSDPKKSS